MDNYFTYLEEVTEIIASEPIPENPAIDTPPVTEPIPENPATDTPPVTEPIPDNPTTDVPPATEPVEGSTSTEGNPADPIDKEQTGTTEPIYTEVIEITEPVPPRYFLDTPIDDYSVTEGFLLVICLLLLVQIAFRK